MRLCHLAAFIGLGSVSALVRGADPQPADPIAYPDHSNLLIVRDRQGDQRPITSRADWDERRKHIRTNMELVMGPVPDERRRVPLEVQIVSETTTDKYVRIKLLYTPEPEDRVSAWLLIPLATPTNHKSAAMLCLHQTNHVGKDEPAGLAGLPALHYAHELAGRGFVCLVPDYPSFGEYKYDFKTQGAHYASGSMKAIWNNIRAVDLLVSRAEVDPHRIGAIGHSLGGHNALFTAFFEPRLRAVVTSCGFTPFHDYYKGDMKGWTSDRYMPRIRDVYDNNADRVPFDFYEILAGLAPRSCYSNSPLHDSNFEVEGVRKAFQKAEGVYKLLNAEGQLKLVTPDAQHDFPAVQRQDAYRWLESQLK